MLNAIKISEGSGPSAAVVQFHVVGSSALTFKVTVQVKKTLRCNMALRIHKSGPDRWHPFLSDVFIDSSEVLKLDLIFVQTGYTNLDYCGASFRVYILYRCLFQQSVTIKLTQHIHSSVQERLCYRFSWKSKRRIQHLYIYSVEASPPPLHPFQASEMTLHCNPHPPQ